MFALPEFTKIYMKSFNVRGEAHGKDIVPAIDIGIQQEGSNNLLLLIEPALKRMHFKPEGTLSDDPELDGIDPISDMTEVRATCVDVPVLLNTSLYGYRLELDYGLGGDSNIHLQDCKLNEFKVTKLIKGGSIEMQYRLQASGLDAETLGLLGSLLKHNPMIKLTGPTAEQQIELQEAARAKVKTEAGDSPDAGDIFAAGGSPPNDAPAKVPAKKTAKVHTLKARMSAAMKKAGAKGQAARP